MKNYTRKPNFGLLAEDSKRLKRKVTENVEIFVRKVERLIRLNKGEDERTPLRKISVFTKATSIEDLGESLTKIGKKKVNQVDNGGVIFMKKC